MIEWLTGSLIYSFGKDVLGHFIKRRRQLTSPQIIAIRQKWKPLFQEEISKNYIQKLRSDVIIRDIQRYDSYPDINEKEKGASPWFRAGLLGAYEKGALIGLSWGGLKQLDENKWRYRDFLKNEDTDLSVVLVGKLPFENIENVDFDGDQYYYYPHIYCWYISKKKGPYEELAFYVKNQYLSELPYYTEVAKYEEVRKLSLKFGLKNFG